MRNPKLENADIHQISNRTFDGNNDAQRVVLVGGGNIEVKADTSNLSQDISNAIKSTLNNKIVEFRDIPTIVKETDYKIIEIPKFIKELEVKTIEIPIIIKEYEIKEIKTTEYIKIPEIITIEKPIIIEKLININNLPLWSKILMTSESVLMIIYLIKHFI